MNNTKCDIIKRERRNSNYYSISDTEYNGGLFMVITSRQVLDLFLHGAHKVIDNKEMLNRINVFPVQDGDTGSNLASMMRTIIHQSEEKETVKATLESVADAALYGARGNSGIIFAQYLTGLSESVIDRDTISIQEYAQASNLAVKYAYESIENPVEGTMISVMREWGTALMHAATNKDVISEIFEYAFEHTQSALKKTKEQLEVLRKAGVVDSGAQGFTFFVEGALYFLKNGASLDQSIIIDTINDTLFTPIEMNHTGEDEYRYCTECLIEGIGIEQHVLKETLKTFGDSVVVAGNTRKSRIHIHTNEPAQVFEYLYQQGSMVFQKIDDMFKQETVVNHRKSQIALVTDSIADLPQEIIDDEQIHIVHIDILYKNISYKDKLTIRAKTLLDLSKEDNVLPTSSQPGPKQIENILDYLSSYYDSVIVLTVSKVLSGTYNNFSKVAEKLKKPNFKISIVNTKQNSGAQGLLVKKCAEYISKGMTHDDIVDKIQADTARSKILVQVLTLDNMIKSGRLSLRAGKIAKFIGMTPIITLDEEGQGVIDGIAFSTEGSNKKLVKHIQKIMKNHKIAEYNIVHVNNEDGAKRLSDKMETIIGKPPVYITETSSVIAVSAGEGAVALSYLLTEEVSNESF